MKRKTTALASIILIAGLYLFYSPGATSAMDSSLGIAVTQVVYDRTSVVVVAPQNYSFVSAKLQQGDSLNVVLTANPGNVDVLLMNQGNFSEWASSRGGSYGSYSQSALHVSNYTFSFIDTESTQLFYVVFLSHASNDVTTVLVHTVIERASYYFALLLSLTLCAVGAILLGYGLLSGRSKQGQAHVGIPAVSPPEPRATFAETGPSLCRHCGAALMPGDSFCSSCGKSQT